MDTTGSGDAQRALNSTPKPTDPCSLRGLQILADLLIGFFHPSCFIYFKAESFTLVVVWLHFSHSKFLPIEVVWVIF